MESLPSEMKKLVSYFAGYLATSIDLIRAATRLSAQDLKEVHDDDKRLPVLIQIGERMIGRTEIRSSASLSDSMQDVAVERDSVLALSDYVVLLKVNGDEIDLQIITEGSSLRSLPMEPLSIDLIVCVFGSSDSLAVQMLKELKRVLKLESEIFLIQTEQSTSLHLVVNLKKAGFQIGDMQIGLKKSGFGYGFEDLIGSLESLLQTKSFQIFKIKEKVSDLIDEDTLISEEDWKRPEYPPVPDPAVGSNTCEWLDEEPLQHCRLGDAFRCRTCPYRGCPRFELGEKVTPNFPPPDD